MGTRINKMLGYGFNDFQMENDSLVSDHRINPHFDEDRLYDSESNFLQWCLDNKDKCIEISTKANEHYSGEQTYYGFEWYVKEVLNGSRDKSFSPICHYDDRLLIFRAVEFPHFHRRDDTIDYYQYPEVYGDDGSLSPAVHDLTHRCGIYPYTGMVRKWSAPDDIKNDPDYPEVLVPSLYNMMTGRWDKNKEPLASGEKLKNLVKWYRATIPDSVLIYTYYIGIFRDWEKSIDDLRPMLYIWWS